MWPEHKSEEPQAQTPVGTPPRRPPTARALPPGNVAQRSDRQLCAAPLTGPSAVLFTLTRTQLVKPPDALIAPAGLAGHFLLAAS